LTNEKKETAGKRERGKEDPDAVKTVWVKKKAKARRGRGKRVKGRGGEKERRRV